MSTMPLPATHDPSTGGRLVSADGRTLPLRGCALVVDAAAGLARVVVRQTFVNPHDEPLRVTWQVPLPADAAVSGFAFELAGRRIVGEVDRAAAARERFEEALVEGRTAALLEQDRSSLFTQEVGNLPPHEEVVCELLLDQRLGWLPEGAWEWRFPTVVAPRYMGGAGRVPDVERVSVDVTEDDLAPRSTLDLVVRDARTGEPTSPSHALSVQGDDIGLAAEGGARLDRDVVVRWPVAAQAPGARLDVARPAADRKISEFAYGLLTLVPPLPSAGMAAVGRDLVVLLDTSGSMSGEPLAQARAVTLALIDTLTERDTLELIEFSNKPRRWQSGPVKATARERAAAASWVRELRAGGATEMKSGILEALATKRAEAQRQVVLITDGLIGFEDEIVAAVSERLPRGSRVHTLGIGSSVNRSLTGPVARAGGGVEAIVGLGEAPAEAARRLVAATDQPVVVDVELGGSALVETAHQRAPDLLAGRPARLAVKLQPGGGTLTVRGSTADGPWEHRLEVAQLQLGRGSAAVVALFGREQVEELDLARVRGESVDAQVERIGLEFQISTRLTSWVAVSESRTVDPGVPTRRERIPQAVPYGTSVEGFGLRQALVASQMRFGGGAAAPPLVEESAAVFAEARAPLFDDDVDAPAQRHVALLLRGRGIAHQRLLMSKAARPAPPPPPRTLRGKVVIDRAGRLVIEVQLSEDLEWSPRDKVTVHRVGRCMEFERLDLDLGTAPGLLKAGQVLRLVIDSQGGPAVEWIEMFNDDMQLVVEVG